jgi:hypothetical protein
VEVAPAETSPRPAGDAVVALVTLFQKNRYRQWLLRITTLELTADEGQRQARSRVMHTSTGTTVRFDGRLLALDLRLIGPFRSDVKPGAKEKVLEKQTRTLVNAELLGVGLDRAAAASLRLLSMDEADGTKKFDFQVSSRPFSAEMTAASRAQAAAADLTPEDERALAGLPLALLAFFGVAQKAPGLKEVLGEMLDKASLAWSALTHGGNLDPSFHVDSKHISVIDTAPWGTNLPVSYRLPVMVTLNAKPALDCQLVVTPPRPPLLASAGILGLVATPPEEKDRLLVIRLLAARSERNAEAAR